MTKKQFYLTFTLTVFAGFLGGLLSGWLTNTGIVRAQSEEVIPKLIRAERFEVVTGEGKWRATLGNGNDGGELWLAGEGFTHGLYRPSAIRLGGHMDVAEKAASYNTFLGNGELTLRNSDGHGASIWATLRVFRIHF